jgi:hypothetical protein
MIKSVILKNIHICPTWGRNASGEGWISRLEGVEAVYYGPKDINRLIGMPVLISESS